jgi:hypothetical protein
MGRGQNKTTREKKKEELNLSSVLLSSVIRRATSSRQRNP